jgi:hypothetical protein
VTYGGQTYGGTPYADGTTTTATQYATATIAIRRFYDHLVDVAERMTNDPAADSFSFAAAIALTHTACEVSSGTALATVIDEKNLGPIAEMASDLLPRTFSLDDDRIRRS